MRERGLKPSEMTLLLPQTGRSPCGAWIETVSIKYGDIVNVSLPMRERGLKHKINYNDIIIIKSLPMRERGLKHFTSNNLSYLVKVAPHAGAWIETFRNLSIFSVMISRSPCGSVD